MSDVGKPDLTLLPWDALDRVALAMMRGNARPGRTREDWREKPAGGFDLLLLGASLRHVTKHLRGRVIDDGPNGTGEPNLACAIASLSMVLERALVRGDIAPRKRTTYELTECLDDR